MSDDKKPTDLTIRHERESFITRYEPQSFDELSRLAKAVVKSGLVPDSVKKAEDAMVILMSGAELGLTAMQSLRSIHVIKGRPTLSADLMVALVRRSSICEYFKLKELNKKRCIYETKRIDGDPVTYEFTWQDASQARLIGRDNWKKYPKNMLRARCSSSLARAEYPELLMGIYDPDELSTPDRRSPTPSPAEVPREEQDVIDAEFEPSEPAPPVDPTVWSEHPKYKKEWDQASNRLHALISECGLNGKASSAIRETLKEGKGVESYTHLSPRYLRAVNARLVKLSHLETDTGEISPRMSHILSVVDMTLAEATGESKKAAAPAHQELRMLADQCVLDKDVDALCASIAHSEGVESFDDLPDETIKRHISVLQSMPAKALEGTKAGTLSPRAQYIRRLISPPAQDTNEPNPNDFSDIDMGML